MTVQCVHDECVFTTPVLMCVVGLCMTHIAYTLILLLLHYTWYRVPYTTTTTVHTILLLMMHTYILQLYSFVINIIII